MKRKRYSVKQIVAAVKQHDPGTRASELGSRVEEGVSFLWMKRIVTEPVCLVFNGEAIAKRYPDDRATEPHGSKIRRVGP